MSAPLTDPTLRPTVTDGRDAPEDERAVYGPPRDEAEGERVAALVDWSFGSLGFGNGADWLALVGPDNCRVLRDPSGTPVSSLGLVEMGQWYGRRRVPAVGVVAVATAGTARGQGHSRELLRRALVEARAAQVPLALLYPASYTLYRKSGFEVAGTAFVHRVAARDIDLRDRRLPVRPLGPEDLDAVKALRATLAREADGNLDRPERLWETTLRRHGVEATGFGVFHGEALVGYVYLRHTASDGPRPYDLSVADVGALNAAAWRRILTLIRDHGSLDAVARWRGPLTDPMTLLLGEEVHAVDNVSHWMARLVDVDGALMARGYFRGVTGELHLDVIDDVLPENTGRRVLALSAGAPQVRAGGDGALRCDVRALAQLYTGFSTASAVARVGGVSGPEPSIALADQIFAGPAPWMSESF